MSKKIILVHVNESAHLAERVEFAARMALHENANLIGVAATGVSRSLHTPAIHGRDGMNISPYNDEYIEALRQRAETALNRFEALVCGIGTISYEKRLIDDEVADAITSQGLYADLIVLGHSSDASLTARVDFTEYVVLNTQCPALILPAAEIASGIGDRILIAWNESMAASRAIRNAMPFLKKAKKIHLAILDPAPCSTQQSKKSGAEITDYLAHHNIEVEVVRRAIADDAGHTLLSLAAELSSDLLVMGCVAHPRYRGVLLGGASAVVLEAATVAVLMSH